MKMHNALYSRTSSRLRLLASVVAVMHMLSYTAPLFALPQGESVASGDVSFSADGDTMTVNQGSSSAIVNYDSFDIDVTESVVFEQPDASSTILNRVNGADASTIAGALLANGQVYIINQSGVLFTETARVDVGGLVASALNISDADFLAGALEFNGGGGRVINKGSISGDYVYLIGNAVQNDGSISSAEVALAAGSSVIIDHVAGGDVTLTIDGDIVDGADDISGGDISDGADGTDGEDAGVDASVDADAGADDAGIDEAADGALDDELVEAETIINSGLIDVSGDTGGTVMMDGSRVGQFGDINADGILGDGGTVDLHAEDSLVLGSDSTTTANAGVDGDGGSISLVSEDTLRVDAGASLAARGGSASGAGGEAEVSGYGSVDLQSEVDLTASDGSAGTFLIDPTDFTISALVTGPNNINVVDLIAQLNLADVTIQTAAAGLEPGDISWTAVADLDGLTVNGRTLRLDAHNSVFVTAGGGTTDSNAGTVDRLNMVFNADAVTPNGAGNVDIDGAIVTGGGSFTSSGNHFDNTGGLIDTDGGAIDINNTGIVFIGADLDSTGGGGSITIGSATAIGLDANVSSGGNVTLSSLGVITRVTAGTVSGGALTADAAAGIDLDVAVSGLDATVSGAGSIVIDELDAIDLVDVDTANGSITVTAGGQITATDVASLTDADANDIDLTSTGAGIGVGLVDAGANGDLLVDAQGGPVTDVASDPADDLVGDVVTVLASAGIGGAAANDDLDIDADSIHLTGGDTIYFNGTDSGSLNANIDGDFSLTQNSNTDDIGVDSLVAGGTIELIADERIIDASDDAVVDIESTSDATITLTAGEGIGDAGGGGVDGRLELADGSVVDAETMITGGIYLRGAGELTLNGLDTSSGGGAIQVTTLNGGDADIALLDAGAGNVTMSIDGDVLDNNGGANNILASDLNITAADQVGSSGDHIEVDVSTLMIDATTGGGGVYVDSGRSSGVTINGIATDGDTIRFEHTDASAALVAGPVSSGDGGTHGGDITIISDGSLSVLGLVSSASGSGGELEIDGASVTADPTVGKGDIFLQGKDPDVLIDFTISQNTTVTIVADRDVDIQALVQTTDGADIIITADATGDGVGGVRIGSAGLVDSDGNVTITGSDLWMTPNGPGLGGNTRVDSVWVEADGGNNQVQAEGDMTFERGANAPATADIYVEGHVESSGGTVSFTDALGTGIGVGNTPVANGVNIDNTELGLITAPAIGATTAGDVTVDSPGLGGSALSIAADDVTIMNALVAGDVTLTDIDGTGIEFARDPLADPLDGPGLNLDLDEIGVMSVASLTLNSGGNVDVQEILESESDALGAVTLDSGGTVMFHGNATFDSLDAQADNGIVLAGTQLGADEGGLSLDGDANSSLDGADGIQFLSDTLLAVRDVLTLSADNGDITAAGALSAYAGTDITMSGDLTTAGPTELFADHPLLGPVGSGDLTTDGINVGASSLDVLADSATFNGAVAAGQVTITARDGITLADSLTAAGAVTLGADSNADGVGDLDAQAISAGANTLVASANDVILQDTIAGGTVRFIVSDGGVAALGGSVVAADFHISDTELADITATTLEIDSAGDIGVHAVAPGDSDNAGPVTLDSGGTVTFSSSSTFDALDAQADNGINVDADVTTDEGALLLNGDADSAVDGNDSIAFADGVTLNSDGQVVLSAANGTIGGPGAVTILADSGIAVNRDLTTAGTTTLDADNNDDGTGDLTAQGITVGGGNELAVTANDVDFNGAISAGEMSVTDSDGTGIRLRFSPDAAGFLNIDAGELAGISLPATANLVLDTDGTIDITDLNTTYGFDARADQGINVLGDPNVGGDLLLDGDYNDADDAGADAVVFGTDTSVSADGDVFLAALTGGVRGDGTMTVTAGEHLTVEGSLFTDGDTVLIADSVRDGVGDLTVDAIQTFDAVPDANTHDLMIQANDISFDTSGSDAINAGTGDILIEESDGSGINLGDAGDPGPAGDLNLSNDELDQIVGARLDLVTAGDVAADGIDGNSTDGFALMAVDAEGAVTFDNGDSTIGAAVVVQGEGGVQVDAGIAVNGAHNILIQSDAPGGSVAINGAVESAGGHVSVLANNDVTQGTDGDISTSGTGTIDVEAENGAVTMASGVSATTGGGNIRYDAANGAEITGLDAGAGSVAVNAGSGAITDGDSAGTDITAGETRLEAGAGIGSDADPIETSVASIAADADGGGIHVDNAGALTVGTVNDVQVMRVDDNASASLHPAAPGAALAGLEATGGDIHVDAQDGNLTVGAAVDADGAGNVVLRSAGSAGPYDVIVNRAVSSGSGDISLVAAHNVAVDADVTTGGGGHIVAWADSNDDSDGDVDHDSGIMSTDRGNLYLRGEEIDQSNGARHETDTGVVSYRADGLLHLDGETDAANGSIFAEASQISMADFQAGDTIFLHATDGAITDNGLVNPALQADSIGLSASEGIGTSGNPVDVAANSLATESGNDQDVFMRVWGSADAASVGPPELTIADFPQELAGDRDAIVPQYADGDIDGIRSDADLWLRASGAIGGTTVRSDGDAWINVGALDRLAALNAGGNLDLDAGPVNVTAIDVGGAADVVSGSLMVDTFTVGDNANLDVASVDGSMLDVNGALVLNSDGSVDIAETEVGGDAEVDSGDLSFDTFAVGGDGDFTVDSVEGRDMLTVDGDLVLNAGGSVDIVTTEIGGNARVDSGDLSFDSLTVGGNAELGVGSINDGETLTVDGALDLEAGGGVTIATIDVGGAATLNTGDLSFDTFEASSVEAQAGNIDMGRLTAGSVSINAGNISDNNSLITASSLLLTAGNIGAPDAHININLSVIDLISGSDVYIEQLHVGDTLLGLIAASGYLELLVPNASSGAGEAGLVDNNGDAVNLAAGNGALIDVRGYVGTPSDPLEANMAGTVLLNSSGLSGNDTDDGYIYVIYNQDASPVGDVDYVGDSVPGLIIINGQVVGGDANLMRKIFRTEAFAVETPELKSRQGVFGNPFFVHENMDISEYVALGLIDFLEAGEASIAGDPDMPEESNRDLVFGGVHPATAINFAERQKKVRPAGGDAKPKGADKDKDKDKDKPKGGGQKGNAGAAETSDEKAGEVESPEKEGDEKGEKGEESGDDKKKTSTSDGEDAATPPSLTSQDADAAKSATEDTPDASDDDARGDVSDPDDAEAKVVIPVDVPGAVSTNIVEKHSIPKEEEDVAVAGDPDLPDQAYEDMDKKAGKTKTPKKVDPADK